MRFCRRRHEAVNGSGMSDKTRHVVDGRDTQRLDPPYLREKASSTQLYGSHRRSMRSRRNWPHRRPADRRHRGRSLASVGRLFALMRVAGEVRAPSISRSRARDASPKPSAASYIFTPRPLPASSRRRAFDVGLRTRCRESPSQQRASESAGEAATQNRLIGARPLSPTLTTISRGQRI